MDEWKDFVILMKDGVCMNLRAKRIGIEDNKYVVAYDDKSMMALVPLTEIKAMLFCDVSPELINLMSGKE